LSLLGAIKKEHIQYLLLPPPTPAQVKAAIPPLVERSRELDGYTLAFLKD
jgi:hypothetical protein